MKAAAAERKKGLKHMKAAVAERKKGSKTGPKATVGLLFACGIGWRMLAWVGLMIRMRRW